MNPIKLKGQTKVCGIVVPEIAGGFGEGKKSMLAKNIAEIHGKQLKHVNEFINERREHFLNGVDVVDVKGTELEVALRDSGIFTQNAINAAKNIYLLSERGYAKLLKIFDDDLAWDKYEELLDGYFRMREEQPQTQDPYATLSPELKAIFIIDKRTQEIETRVEHLENNSSIERGQRQFLRSQAHANVVKLLGGKESPAYQNSKLRSKTFSAMWRDYQEYFETNSYENTPKKDFDKAKDYVMQWSPQGKLLREIEEANSQLQMSEV